MVYQPYLNLQDYYNIQMQNYLANLYGQQMQDYMKQGAAKGAAIYGEGSLGRLDATSDPQYAALLSDYQSGYQQGFDSPIYQANRERYMADINQGIQTGLQQSAVQAANQGVRGATASNLARDQQRQAYLSRNAANRQAAMDDFGFRNQQQAAYNQGLQYQLDRNRAAEMYNQQQKLKELQGRQAYEFGYGSLGAAQQGAAAKYVAGQQQVAAASNQPAGGGK